MESAETSTSASHSSHPPAASSSRLNEQHGSQYRSSSRRHGSSNRHASSSHNKDPNLNNNNNAYTNSQQHLQQSSSSQSQSQSNNNNNNSNSNNNNNNNNNNTSSSSSRKRIKAPSLPSANVSRAPANHLYWSKTPVWGTPPPHGLRAHTSTLYGSKLFVFGGCDHRGCFRDLFILNLDTLRWTKPHTHGSPPPPLRAHSATLVNNLIYVFGGGEGPAYFNETYILNAETLVWSKPRTLGEKPPVRRAHTAIYDEVTYHIYIFGGGNGSSALNDCYSLDVADSDRLEWRKLFTSGQTPASRGYHTANLIKRKMVVYGGSDGSDCFGDVYILDLDTMTWSNFAPVFAPTNQVTTASNTTTTATATNTNANTNTNTNTTTNNTTTNSQHKSSNPDESINSNKDNTNNNNNNNLTPTRLAHTATQVGPFLFILAGHDGQRYRSDLLLFNLITLQFETRPTSGIPPSPRGYPTVTLYENRIFLLGGFDGKTVFDDVHTLDLSTSAYLTQVRSFDIDLNVGLDDMDEDFDDDGYPSSDHHDQHNPNVPPKQQPNRPPERAQLGHARKASRQKATEIANPVHSPPPDFKEKGSSSSTKESLRDNDQNASNPSSNISNESLGNSVFNSNVQNQRPPTIERDPDEIVEVSVTESLDKINLK